MVGTVWVVGGLFLVCFFVCLFFLLHLRFVDFLKARRGLFSV